MLKKSRDNAAARVVAKYKLANCNVWKYTDNLAKDVLGKVHNFSAMIELEYLPTDIMRANLQTKPIMIGKFGDLTDMHMGK